MKPNKTLSLSELIALPRNSMIYVEELPASNYGSGYASRTEFEGKPTLHFSDRTRVELDENWDKMPGGSTLIVRRAWTRKPEARKREVPA